MFYQRAEKPTTPDNFISIAIIGFHPPKHHSFLKTEYGLEISNQCGQKHSTLYYNGVYHTHHLHIGFYRHPHWCSQQAHC